MNIEEIKADLEEIARIRAERDEAFYKIRPEDFTGCLPYDKFLNAQGAVNDKCWTAIDAVTSKYLFIFESDGVDIAPAYYPTGHRIDDFLKFFLALYDDVTKWGDHSNGFIEDLKAGAKMIRGDGRLK